jgi:hypothetical protein
MFSTGKTFMPDLLSALKIVADIPHRASPYLPDSAGILPPENLCSIKIVVLQALNRISGNETSYPAGYTIWMTGMVFVLIFVCC